MVGKRNTFINSIVWILLIVLLCTNLLSVHVQAAETTEEGFEYIEEAETTEEGFVYVEENDTITIIGYSGTNKDVEIPEKINGKPVTVIERLAFAEKGLTSVIIPNSLTRIEEYTFSDNQLTSVTIPNGVTRIEEYAFKNNQLTSVTIPDSVIYLSGFNDNRLTSITIPSSVKTFGNYAFSNNQLTSVTIPSSVEGISTWAFYNNQLTTVTIPESVTAIGMYSFTENPITNVSIPDGIPILAVPFGFTVDPTMEQILEACFDPGVTLIEDVPAPNEPIPDETPAPSESKPTEPTTTPTTAPTTTPAPAEPVEIEMVEATVGWTTGSDQPAVFTSNAEFADFLHVTVDGNIVDAENYEVKEGSTIISFKPRFLAALSAGSYPVEIVSKTGVAKGVLEIKAQVTPEPVNVTPTTQPTQSTETLPRTGENSGLYLWLALVFLSASGLLYAARKKKVSKQ
ncbi:MAG TPA: leucine-rich repeat protein [Clostridiaceae bacterium]|nr:leucine-rich repeat protein [Clostridiaceae bacterium]